MRTLLIIGAIFVLFYTNTFVFKINNPNTKESVISLSKEGIDKGIANIKHLFK